MRRLSFIIGLILGLSFLQAQSPHGPDFKISCESCHNPSGWSLDYNSLQFNHGNQTEFDLDGAHKLIDCTSCHQDLSFKGTPNDCASCHLDVHNQTVGNDCIRCHDSDSWIVSEVPEIHEQNGFVLTGPHSNLSCVECHTDANPLNFFPIGNDCISCHNDDFQSTTSPNHLEAGYSLDCTECHSPIGFGWNSESINHDFFPLTQGHDISDCSQCHTTGTYADASPECVSCHQNDYNQTSDPNHQQAGFSTDCASCHTTAVGWKPAGIDHDFFPLTLGHDIGDCTQCHTTGNYADASPECVSCHQNDYNQTSDPNHQAANFPLDCASCHSTNPDWKPVDWDHDGQYFPIYSGEHRGEWNACTDCHTNASDYSVFSCFACHGQSSTDNEHRGVNGYTYDSMACLQCHPDGSED
ncbi:MAG: hypothetical protein RLZZ241_1998 [Bacteroidota bacterium]|jgi:hypothetical protein